MIEALYVIILVGMVKRKTKKRSYHFKHSFIGRWWRRYEYKHTTLALLAIIIFVLALNTALIQSALSSVKELGLIGIVIAGSLFTSFFTTAPAIVMFMQMSDVHSPLLIAFYGAIGSVIGDWIILKLFEEKVGYELLPLAKKFHMKKFLTSLKRKKNRDRTTILGMIAIASPLPDELGIGLLGIAHLPTVSLLVITFLLNAAGILVLVFAVR